MGNFTKEDMRESNRLKEKACENCMGKLKGTVSEEEMQQFQKAFYTASEGICSVRRKVPAENRDTLLVWIEYGAGKCYIIDVNG